MLQHTTFIITFFISLVPLGVLKAEDPPRPSPIESKEAILTRKLNAIMKECMQWGTVPIIVSEVKKVNSNPSSLHKKMTNSDWLLIGQSDPLMRELTNNPAAYFLKQHKSEYISEVFISAADGTKVALIEKTTHWSHKGKKKHDEPMKKNVWMGKFETNSSNGKRQIQISVPVFDQSKPIGSLTVGVDLLKILQ